MNSHYRVVVIGGGVVGASVLYHPRWMGWRDVCLLERSVLTGLLACSGRYSCAECRPQYAGFKPIPLTCCEIEKKAARISACI